MSKILL